MKIRGYDLINRGYAAAFNQLYGVEARISPVWIEHSDIRPIISPSVHAGSDSKGVSRDATDHIDPVNRLRVRHGMSVSSNCKRISHIRIYFSSCSNIRSSFLLRFTLDMDRERLRGRIRIFSGYNPPDQSPKWYESKNTHGEESE